MKYIASVFCTESNETEETKRQKRQRKQELSRQEKRNIAMLFETLYLKKRLLSG
jgi:hypothetical protein